MKAIDYGGGLGAATAALAQRPRLQGRPPPLGSLAPRETGTGAPSIGGLRDIMAMRDRPARPGAAPSAGPIGAVGPPAGAAHPAPGPVEVETLPPPDGVPVAMVVEPWAFAGAPGFASGGLASVRRRGLRARRVSSSGLVHSASPGREDLVSTRLRRGSYVLPADVVSGLGQGNTLAGAKLLQASLPEAVEMASAGRLDRAMGGMIEDGDEMDVRLSGGEFLVSPEQVLALGEGDVEAGAQALDDLVHAVRSSTRDALGRMPPPK